MMIDDDDDDDTDDNCDYLSFILYIYIHDNNVMQVTILYLDQLMDLKEINYLSLKYLF